MHVHRSFAILRKYDDVERKNQKGNQEKENKQ